MLERLLSLPQDCHILLFGPRNCGKSTLIQKVFKEDTRIYIDLLQVSEEERFSANPDSLFDIVSALPDKKVMQRIIN